MKAVEFKNVSKSYLISRYKYGKLTDSLNGLFMALTGRENKTLRREKFWAVKNLNLSIETGTVVGIIGKNGSGKSTILKLISRIIYPDKGEISASGRIGAFIELGAGLHPELTGRENIFLYGSILGMTNKEIKKQFDAIVDFAEIHKFLDTPIKRYSSGMYSRLGFSVCAFCNPDILLVDEVLAVGDAAFEKKCLSKMQDFAKSNKTIVFVSHDLESIKKICNKVVLLDHGNIRKIGNPREVIATYLGKYAQKSLE